jgi:hypothetical protein
MLFAEEFEKLVALCKKIRLTIADLIELTAGLVENGYSREQVFFLIRDLKKLKCFVNGEAILQSKVHMIDCDTKPEFLGKTVAEHQKGGMWNFDPDKITLRKVEKQIAGDDILARHVYKEIACLPVLNSNVLDYLLQHQEIIPDDWKDKYIFFWGTIYRNSNECSQFENSWDFNDATYKRQLFVRCLFMEKDGWCSKFFWFGSPMNLACYSAVKN